MGTSARATNEAWTADAFLRTDQHAFGDAWRYELIEGVIVALAAQSPDHGAILSGLTAALATRLAGRPNGCRPEAGSGAGPTNQQRPTARIPDAIIRCGDLPRVAFDVVSASELKNWNACEQRRAHLQGIAGIQEIVEIYQREAAIHVYRRQEDGQWTFAPVIGLDASMDLQSVGLAVPLSQIYQFVDLDASGDFGGQ